MIKLLIFLFALFGGNFYLSQAISDIQNLKDKNQKCLDEGSAMHICSYDLYNSSDALLNRSYQKLYNQLDIKEQRNLKQKQRIWLKERDLTFKNNFEEAKKLTGFSENTQDFKMVLSQKNATFVLERTQFLIEKIK